MYYLKARLFPTILTVIPFITGIFLLTEKYSDCIIISGNYFILLSRLLFIPAVFFLMVQINRVVAKEIFQRFYFADELNMPTTIMLLWSDRELTISMKEKIRKLIENKFGIKLNDEYSEKQNPEEAKRLIATAVSQVRNVLRETKLLLNHNIEYGFVRNLIGGSLVSFLFSLICAIICCVFLNELKYSITFASFAIFYLIPILLSSLIIKKYGKYYAKVLFEQFLTLK